jgi:hypothetical protein
MQITQLYAPAPLSDRIAEAEAQVARGCTVSRLAGDLSAGRDRGRCDGDDERSRQQQLLVGDSAVCGGPLRAVRIDAQAAGTGTLILAQIDGGTLTPLHAGRSP